MKTPSIYEIKRQVEKTNPSSHYFDRATLKFFGQSLTDFRVSKVDDYRFLIAAPSYWSDKLMGYSQRIFNASTNNLEDVPENLQIKTIVI